MAIKFLSGQTISGTLTVSGNVQGATFNGLAINTTGTNNVANQIVRTQANGYVNFGWINSISGNHTGSITRITASNDAYLRYVTPAQFRTGVTDGFYAPSSTVSGVTSVGGTGTVSGITLTGTVTSTGNLTLGGTLSASITNISNASNWWNNFGDVHGTRTGFDASTASYSFGWRYVQGNTNGPGTGGTQFYSAYVGLGSQYPATGSGSYGAYLAFDRNVANPYLSIRYNEANVLGTWKKISAGTADILTTARTIAGVSFNGSANISLNNNAITNGAGYTTNTGTVTSVATGSGLTGGTITTTGTLSVDGTVIRTTGNQSITGNTTFYPSSTSTSYSTAAIELMSSSSGTGGTPPRISWHWGGVVASLITIESNGTIAVRNNPGNDYEKFKASTITATGVVYANGGNSNTWNSHTSNTGTVTSVATGSGLTGGTITTTGTLSLDRPNSQLGAVLATYGTTAGASGRVRCTAPFNTNTGKMFSIEITLYTSYTQHNYVVSAYMYSTTNQWYAPKAIYTTTGTATPDIYVGRDGNGKAYISIANASYTGVLVHNMTRGYQTSLADTYDPWTITINSGNENSTSVAVSTVYTSANLPAYPSVGNGQIDGRTSGLGISGSMDATANQTGNTTFTVTSNAVEAATASTLVYRNSSADINVRLLRANYQDQTTISGAIAYRINNSSDNYTRYCSSPSAIRTFLGVPASGDLGNYLPLAGGIMSGNIGRTASNKGFQVGTYNNVGDNRTHSNPLYGIGTSYLPALTTLGNMYGIGYTNSAASFISLTGASGWGQYVAADGDARVWLDGSNGNISTAGVIYAAQYYDYNNTAYYLDPASTSNLNAGAIQGTWTMSTQKALVADDYGRGVYGLYNASRLQHMWSMGTAYNLADNGTSAGNLYGMAWSHPNAGGVAANLSNHGQLLLLNGGYRAAISGSIRCVTDMRTPIYYDSNNTGYYMDPSSTSNTVNMYAVTQMRAPIYYSITNTAYYTRPHTSSYINSLHTAGNIQAGSSGSGNIYIGGTSGNYFRFHTNNSHTYFDANVGNINWRQGASTRFTFYMTTANMTINGSLTQNSDERVKENIVEILNAIDKVKAMKGVYYNRTDFNTGVTKVGVLAQEVEAVLPELIVEAPDSGLKSVAYGELTAVLINAIKELEARVQELENN